MEVIWGLARPVHVLAGVFWAGAVFTLAGFIEPTGRALGPDGGRFIGHLVQRRRFSLALTVAGALTVLSGLLLLGRNSGGFQLAWIATGPGLGFTLGGAAALVTFLLGFLVNGPTATRLTALGQRLEAERRPPTPQEARQLGALRARLRQATLAGAALLAVAVVGMALARYL